MLLLSRLNGNRGRSREGIISSSRSRPLALVTGASSGIGAAFAERLARDGHDLILVARRRDRLETLAERLRYEAGAEARPLAADLADAEGLSQVEAHIAGDERLALLVNNAGFGGYRPFVEVEPKVVDELIAVHVRAVARLTRAAVPGMVRRGKGAVINVASLLALSGALPPNPLPYRAVYAGAKAFILAFTEALCVGSRLKISWPRKRNFAAFFVCPGTAWLTGTAWWRTQSCETGLRRAVAW